MTDEDTLGHLKFRSIRRGLFGSSIDQLDIGFECMFQTST